MVWRKRKTLHNFQKINKEIFPLRPKRNKNWCLFDTYEWELSFLFTISENQMNRYIISKEKIILGKIGKNRDADKSRADEKLRKNVRRTVKNTVVPANLEAKVWNLIKGASVI